jgi:small subunit ribosomal protein S1
VSGGNYSSESGAEAAPETGGGSLASDAQLAALREKLSGNA